MNWDHIERGTKVVGTVAILVSLVAWLASRAGAADVNELKTKQAATEAVLPLILDKVEAVRIEVKSIGEAQRQEVYRLHGVIIPDPASTAPAPPVRPDGGAR